MDDKTKVLISLGAATAANCVPCFEHYFGQALGVGLTPEEIKEAANIADKVKKGAQMTIRKHIADLMDGDEKDGSPCTGTADRPCCA